jgi:hypothetical protein
MVLRCELGKAHGFVHTRGHFTTIDIPGAIRTQTFGINDSGQIVGSYADCTGFMASLLRSQWS